MAIYLVTYIYTDDTAGRDAHRDAHKEYLGRLGEEGVNRVSGRFGDDETPGALLMIKADSKKAAIAATDNDPFRVNGLVSSVTAQEWIPIMGPLAETF
ncbi:MAG: YciI family protein [Actinomycetaceae bacterium]